MRVQRLASYTIRAIYLLLLIVQGARGDFSGMLFNSVAFIASLPLLWLARSDKRYYVADAFAIGLFLLTDIAGTAGIVLKASIMGWDKLFHALGGMVVAYPAWIWFSGRTDKWTAAIATVGVAVSVGAWWEVFELAYFWLLRNDLITTLTYTDTVLDLVAVTIGAKLSAAWLLLRAPQASRGR